MAEIIEFYGRREIQIHTFGKQKKDLNTIIIYELDKIIDSYHGLNYIKLIPCNCVSCRNDQDPHFYQFSVLRRFLIDGQQVIQCQRSYTMVDIYSLIDDVLVQSHLHQSDKSVDYLAKDFIFNAPIENLVIQPTGDITMSKNKQVNQPVIRSAWANGSFYLFTFAVVIAALGFLANSVPFYTLAIILVAGILFIPLIGVLQLRQDDRLSEKSFIELLKLVVGQLPLIGRIARQSQQ